MLRAVILPVLGFSIVGTGVANGITKEVTVPITKTIIDSMYEGAIGGIGSDIGRRWGW